MIKRLRDESGYSLVEVMVAIMLLAIAIIPMVAMFDMGLNAATQGSNYDKARKLADTNLDKVRALPYAEVQVAYKPVNADPPDPNRSVSCDKGIFVAPRGSCKITTTYVDISLSPNSASTTRMQVTVAVEWDGNKSYTTTGLKAR